MRRYPDSRVEIQGLSARYYDLLLDVASLGTYRSFINNAIASLGIEPDDKILDLGAGTGRNALLMSRFLGGNGRIVGMEISDEMIKRFRQKTKGFSNIELMTTRIDEPFDLGQRFDKAFISFVIHGFPHSVRETIIQSVYNNLSEGGEFIILDYNEFALEKAPFWIRLPFRVLECKYAFDFIQRNWKKILTEFNFGGFVEKTFMMNYIRLLKAKKMTSKQ